MEMMIHDHDDDGDDDDIVEESDGDGLPAYVPASACQRWRGGRR